MAGEKVAFWSGHANSSAMVLRMKEIHKEPDLIVYASTGGEFDEVYDFMERFEKIIGIQVIRCNRIERNPDYQFEAFFNRPWLAGCNLGGQIHGMPHQNRPCWHHRNVKEPCYKQYGWGAKEQYIGFTIDEIRRATPMLATHPNSRFPLIEWGWHAKDSIEYLRKQGIPHFIYDLGFDRMGCWFCHQQGEKALRIIFEHFPDKWEKLLEYERRSPHGFKAKSKTYLAELSDKWEDEHRANCDDVVKKGGRG
jgi:3'-phosphoadenosine 5'-phosphosulfate sulfotransferase (PAPS reductase)/FAD synthetase